MPTTGALSANGAIEAELIGAAPASMFPTGSTVAAAASVRIATLMRGIQLGAVPRCRTIALPLAGAPKLGSDHQRIGTDRREVEAKAGPRRYVPLPARVVVCLPPECGQGRGTLVVVLGALVVDFGLEVVGATVVDVFGGVVGGAGKLPTSTWLGSIV